MVHPIQLIHPIYLIQPSHPIHSIHPRNPIYPILPIHPTHPVQLISISIYNPCIYLYILPIYISVQDLMKIIKLVFEPDYACFMDLWIYRFMDLWIWIWIYGSHWLHLFEPFQFFVIICVLKMFVWVNVYLQMLHLIFSPLSYVKWSGWFVTLNIFILVQKL